ncbi:uncharacterized protein LOC131166694 [Malania oleifera]|uniref:uncharacterized protein LOC131166694 n=1 Tax=Malania oleifera TaxID=397392 RepID=UPI0025AE0104|nr:uncharacterized protein LOC131166694 [Malania oleifera]
MRQLMQEIRWSVRRREHSLTAARCTIERFTRIHPPTFSGGPDPMIAKDWVEKTKRLLEVLHCTDKQRVLYATFQLSGEAGRWWTAANEFSVLTQGDMTVQGYAARYIKLSLFAPCLISNEYEKTRRFDKGLRKDIHKLVGMLQIREFSVLVDKTTVIETDIR